jgi:dihydroflavonol-4-reductase
MNQALVTGANGHIGANLVRELVANGYRVVAFVRSGADLRGLEGLDVELVRGDILDSEAVARAATGCRTVFHLATPYVLWARDERDIVDPAVVGTENVLRAAKSRSVERVVLTGSCNAVGFTRGEPLDETSWRDAAVSPYVRAKRQQELRARDVATTLDVDVVTVLPTAVLGPHDYRKTPTTATLIDMLRGRSSVPFAMNLVDVRDVARGHRLAVERGRRGERYLLGGENADVATLASYVAKHTGKKPKEGLPPAWILRVVGALSEAIANVSGKPPMITRAILDDGGGGSPLFKIDKARNELGYAPQGAEEVFAAAVSWAREMKWLGESGNDSWRARSRSER